MYSNPITVGVPLRKSVGKVERPENSLLAALPKKDYRRLAEHLELAPLTPGQVLLGTGRMEFVYFPVSGVVAKVVEVEDGQQVGAGLIGREGMIPLCCFLKLETTPFRAVVQNAGQAWRMRVKDFHAMVQPGELLHSNLLRFSAVFAAQVSFATACSRLHQVPQQYCRWLLMTHNRVGADEFELRQDTVAGMLGVRRMSVTAAARQLLDKGLIEYSRGKVRILNRRGLEQMSCECYRRTYAAYQTVMGCF